MTDHETTLRAMADHLAETAYAIEAAVGTAEPELERQRAACLAGAEALRAALVEIETLKGAMAADDARLRHAERRVYGDITWGCDAPDHMADTILALRAALVERTCGTCQHAESHPHADGRTILLCRNDDALGSFKDRDWSVDPDDGCIKGWTARQTEPTR